MVPLFRGSIDGWFPAQSLLSHLLLIVPSPLRLHPFIPGSSALICLCFSTFLHGILSQWECLTHSCLIFRLWSADWSLISLPSPFFFFHHFFLNTGSLFDVSLLFQSLTSIALCDCRKITIMRTEFMFTFKCIWSHLITLGWGSGGGTASSSSSPPSFTPGHLWRSWRRVLHNKCLCC